MIDAQLPQPVGITPFGRVGDLFFWVMVLGGLAPILVQQVIAKIGELKASRGLTVLMAEQNFEQASSISDRGYVLVHGAIAFASDDLAGLRDNDLVRELYFGA